MGLTHSQGLRIEGGNYEKKPDHHLDNIVNWIDLIKSPGNMSAGEFKLIAKEDPLQFPFAPFKPQKSYYYRQLIRDTMTSIDIDTLKNTLTRAYLLLRKKRTPKQSTQSTQSIQSTMQSIQVNLAHLRVDFRAC